jgi:hypothetical protein
VNLEIVRAVILFAIGDPTFRAQLVQEPDRALEPYGLGVDERLLLSTIQFNGPITFTDEHLLEQLLGSAKTGWEAFGGFAAASGLAVPDLPPEMADLLSAAGGFDLLDDPDFGLPRIDDPNVGADLAQYGLAGFGEDEPGPDPDASPPPAGP